MGCCRLSQIENSNEYPSAAAASVGASALQRCPPDTRTLNTGRRWLMLFRNYAADLGFAAQDISRVLAEFSAVAQKIFKLGIAENDTPYMRFLGGIIGYYAIRKSARGKEKVIVIHLLRHADRIFPGKNL